jgi:hypothetical protein
MERLVRHEGESRDTDKLTWSHHRRLFGGKVHSLIDKVYDPNNLEEAWQRVWENRGSAGIDGVGSAKVNGADQTRWPIAYFTELGLYSLQEAHASARQSSCR